MSQLIQMQDTIHSNTELAEFYGFEADISAGQFMIISCGKSERSYLGQIVAPQRNFNRDSLGPYDNQTINMLERLKDERLAREVGVKEVFHYLVRLLNDVTAGKPESVRKRPQVGSMAREASEEEIIRYLKLPDADEVRRIGSIIDTNIAVCVNKRILTHHVLIAGSTGCGKSNTIANFVSAAQSLEACGFIFDHKPDYQNVHEVNDEGEGAHYKGLSNVHYYCIGDKRRNPGEQPIAVPASALDPSVLAHTICYVESERNSAEALYDLLLAYADEREDQSWSLEAFKAQMPKTHGECKEKLGIDINKQTFDAMRRKLQRSARTPSWIDGKGEREFFGLEPFNLEKLIRPGHIIVIRVGGGSGGGRGYGLFLSYILKEVSRLREKGSNNCPVVQVIDEAQDIFTAGKSFQAVAGAMLDENIRKGRSQDIGFIIGVQSAEAVPEDIRNNLNSQFIFRHNNADQAKEAMARATKEQLAMTNSFSPGECLAYINLSNSVVHVKARLSPFKLTKQNGDR